MEIIAKDSAVINQLSNRKKLKLPAIAKKAMMDNKDYLVEIQQDQMRAGKNAKGWNPDYAPITQELKMQSDTYHARFPSMDFYDTGDFQDNMFLENDGGFNSTDWKTNNLIQDYGEEILQPNPETLDLGQSVVTPEYLETVHQKLNK